MVRTISSLTFLLTIVLFGCAGQASAAETGSEPAATPLPVRSPQDADATAIERGKVVVVVSPETRLMLGPEVVAVVAMGSELRVTQVKGNWAGGQVEIEGEKHVGWIYIGHVRLPGPRTTGPIADDATEDDFTIRSLVVSRDADLASVDPSARIGRLVLIGNGLTKASLSDLKEIASVDELRIENTPIGDTALAHLKERTDLRSLRLWRCQVSDAALQHLKNLTGLEFLDLEGTAIRGTGLEYLKDLAKLRTLILGPAIEDAGLVHVGNLAGLEELDLGRCVRVTDAGLAPVGKLTKLRTLRLPGNATDSCLESISGLTGLQTIRLSPKITDAGKNKLNQALPNCKLRP
jgi:hypothetical protein